MTQQELTQKHGTPSEFEKAVWAAYSDLMITYDEAIAAIQKYRSEWLAAPGD